MKKHLAELNVGRLVAPNDDPRVAEFMDNLDRVNGLGKRMPGFVWMMEGLVSQALAIRKMQSGTIRSLWPT